MRKGIAAVAVAGSIFAVTAAGASILQVTSGPPPAAGTAAGRNCTGGASIFYTATSTFPADVYSVDIEPTVEPDCQGLAALIEVQYGAKPLPGVGPYTYYVYRPDGLMNGKFSLLAGDLCDTGEEAVLAEGAGCGTVTSFGRVTDFTDPTTSITIANTFKTFD